eukprot:1159128-Pelagomonas_calceolata.AAC.7
MCQHPQALAQRETLQAASAYLKRRGRAAAALAQRETLQAAPAYLERRGRAAAVQRLSHGSGGLTPRRATAHRLWLSVCGEHACSWNSKDSSKGSMMAGDCRPKWAAACVQESCKGTHGVRPWRAPSLMTAVKAR